MKMTSTYPDDGQSTVKMELVDDMDEMLNFEIPMTIEIPDFDEDEVDPLMPIPPSSIKSRESMDVGDSDGMPIGTRVANRQSGNSPVIKVESDSGTSDGFCLDSSRLLGRRTEIKSEDDSDTISNVEECDVEQVDENLTLNGLLREEPLVSDERSQQQVTQLEGLASKQQVTQLEGLASKQQVTQLEGQTHGLARRLSSSDTEHSSSLLNQPSLKTVPALLPLTWPTLAALLSPPTSAVAAVTEKPSVPVTISVLPLIQRAVQPGITAVPTVPRVISEPVVQAVTSNSLSTNPMQPLESLTTPPPTLNAVPAAQAPVQPLHRPRKILPRPPSNSSVTVQTELPNPLGCLGVSTARALVAPLGALSPVPATPLLPDLKVRPRKKSVSVSQVLKNPFTGGHWTKEQQLAILTQPRPTPYMESSTSATTQSLYENNPWLCGCMKLKQYFCWPCVLFLYHSPDSMVWCIPSSAVAKSDIFVKTLQAHEVTEQHQQAQKKLSSWLEDNTPSQPAISVKKRYRNLQVIERVGKNRKLLSLLVQSICHMKKVSNDAEIEAYYQCFDHVVGSSKELQDTLVYFQGNTSPESIATFITSHAPLLEASVKELIQNKISGELKNARFVTLFFEDFSSVVDSSTVAVIAHYIDRDGKIQQHVIELLKVDKDRSAEKTYEMVQTVVTKHALPQKLAGYTYSPTLIHPSETSAFNEKIEAFCPKSRFFHYQKHDLMGMLFGALSHLDKKCNNFFHTIVELRDFFNKHLVSSFHHYELTKPNPSNFEYDFDYFFIATLRKCYSAVLHTLGRVIHDPADWDGEVVSQAPIFMAFLQDTTNRFLILLISQLSLSVWDLAKALKGKIVIDQWKMLVDQTCTNFLLLLRHGFKDIYDAAVSPIFAKCRGKTNLKEPPHLVTIYQEVIHTAIVFLKLRFSTPDFGFVLGDWLHPNPKVVFQDPLKDRSWNDYFSRLNCNKEELDNMCIEIDHVRRNPMLQCKSLATTLKSFYDYNLAKVLPCYAKFLDLAVTIPCSHTILHCPIVERIQSHRLNHTAEPLSQEAVWMEKELLAEIANSKKLTENVIDILTFSDEANVFSYGKEVRAYLGLQ